MCSHGATANSYQNELHKKISIEIFHNRLSMNSLNLMTKKLQSIGFDPRISSVEGQCANHYTMEPSSIAVIFKMSPVYTSLLL